MLKSLEVVVLIVFPNLVFFFKWLIFLLFLDQTKRKHFVCLLFFLHIFFLFHPLLLVTVTGHLAPSHPSSEFGHLTFFPTFILYNTLHHHQTNIHQLYTHQSTIFFMQSQILNLYTLDFKSAVTTTKPQRH